MRLRRPGFPSLAVGRSPRLSSLGYGVFNGLPGWASQGDGWTGEGKTHYAMHDLGRSAPSPGESCVQLFSGSNLSADGQEREIVQRARSGDQQALAELYDFYFPRIYRYILARTGNQTEAEDVTEEVFVKMLGAIGAFQWRQAPFAAWLFRIARNHLVSYARKNGARRQAISLEDSIPDPSPDPLSHVEDRLDFEQVFIVARALPQAQREVLWLRFGAGLSVSDTADALGKREGNVKVLQHKAIAKLQKLLAQPGLESTDDLPAGPPAQRAGR
jgi:RNA polymerase sigma-70 factor (ECF subfamily)